MDKETSRNRFTAVAILAILLGLLVVFLSSCADRQTVTSCLMGQPYGFWGGLWHGMIAPFDCIGMIFFDDVTVYATNNNGGWYAFGFCLGVGAFSSGATRTVSHKRK